MERLATTWLAEQCGMLPGATRGFLLRVSSDGSPRTAARWPQGAGEAPDLEALAIAAIRDDGPLVDARPPRSGTPLGFARVAVPFRLEPGAGGRAAVVVEVVDAKASEGERLVEQLRAGIGWLGALGRHAASRGRLGAVAELLDVALEPRSARLAATAVATQLAGRIGCERVTLGFERGGLVRPEALSHAAGFDAKSRWSQDVEAAMNEACDQDGVVCHPAPVGFPDRVARAHGELVARSAGGAACSVPMASGGRLVGAMTFEWGSGGGPDAACLRACEDAAALLGPLLDLRREAEASPLARLRRQLADRFAELRSAGHTAFKLATAALLAVVLLPLLLEGDYRVTAEARLEGRVQRAIVAGIDGYLAEVQARPGDVVREGELLGRLDERDLLVERRRWTGRREQLRQEHREALATRDLALVNVLAARIDQAEAQLMLLEANLLRTRLLAPFDGVVVRGDLSQSLGSPVAKGDVLLEVAPLDGYRVILEVDERDLPDVAEGQRGELVLSALPGEGLPFAIERLTPVASAEEGRNVFRVEARLDAHSEALRPGMEGVAKVHVGRERLGWIWTHRMLDWLRLQLWSWGL